MANLPSVVVFQKDSSSSGSILNDIPTGSAFYIEGQVGGKLYRKVASERNLQGKCLVEGTDQIECLPAVIRVIITKIEVHVILNDHNH